MSAVTKTALPENLSRDTVLAHQTKCAQKKLDEAGKCRFNNKSCKKSTIL